jgi:hypothetical protein
MKIFSMVLALLLSALIVPSRAADTLRHVVSFKFKPTATPEQIKAVEQAFAALQQKIPQVVSLQWGTNVSKEKRDKGFTHCFVLAFRNEQDRDTYLEHPEHKAFGKLVGPVLDDVFVMDFQANETPNPGKAESTGRLVPLELKLPVAAFKGTPPEIKTNAYTDPLPLKQPPVPLVPPGLKNIALGLKASCSDTHATSEALAKLTDGDKDALDESVLTLRKGAQWVQLDFGSPQELFAVALWHAHDFPKVYHAVVVRVADDPDFMTNIRTLFNNDRENASGLGVGPDREYFESCFGKTIDAKGVKARYLRCYSKGSTQSVLNEYTEIEVYGRPIQ